MPCPACSGLSPARQCLRPFPGKREQSNRCSVAHTISVSVNCLCSEQEVSSSLGKVVQVRRVYTRDELEQPSRVGIPCASSVICFFFAQVKLQYDPSGKGINCNASGFIAFDDKEHGSCSSETGLLLPKPCAQLTHSLQSAFGRILSPVNITAKGFSGFLYGNPFLWVLSPLSEGH